MAEQATEEKKIPLTGTELRDRSWRLINASNLDYSPKYIATVAGSVPINGLIRTPMGYYRLAEDTRDGTRVLLHSYERSELQGVYKDGPENGVVVLPETDGKDYDVYGVTARQNVRGAIFRDDMNHDIRFLERRFQMDLNLHAAVPEELEDGDSENTGVISFVNGRGGFGLYETEEGKWAVSYYSNLRKDWDNASRFTKIDGKKQSGKLSKAFSGVQDIKEFDSYEEGFQYIRRLWNTAALRLFKGKELPFEPKGAMVNLKRGLLNFWDKKMHRTWMIAVPIGIIAGVASTLVTGTPAMSALFGVGATASWVVGAKAIEEIVYHAFKKNRALKDQKALEALMPYFDQNDIGKYLSNDPANENRFRKKIKPEDIPYLRLLNHEEADMNYDDGEITPATNPMKDFERVSTAPYRYFGAIFDSSHYDQGLLVSMFPNGLVMLTQVDVKTRATRNYMTYREEFNEIKGDKKHLDPSLTKLPGDGPIHKITHYQGKDFRYASLSGEEFLADLSAHIGEDVSNHKAFGIKITDLFNVKVEGKVVPRFKAGFSVQNLPHS